MENKLEITKKMGSFMTGVELNKQGIELFFTSDKEGQITFVTLKIYDFNNCFLNVIIFLEQKQVRELVELLKKAPATYKELKEMKDKSDILQ